MEIENKLAAIRQKRGISASHLARMVGVSRQTIYAIEAGSYVPNTVVGLRLAKALEVTVEDLFSLDDSPVTIPLRTERVSMLPGSDTVHGGQPVQLCRVEKRLIASPPSPVPWYFPPADAILVEDQEKKDTARVHRVHADGETRNTLLVAGCDPGISLLARHVQRTGVELVLAHRNSSQALSLLKQRWVHVAGTHLRDEASGESNLPAIGRMFPKKSVAVVSFAVWEEGIVTAPGNPKSIRGIGDLARRDISIVNREPGAGSRQLLDTRLKLADIEPGKVRGYDRVAPGHLPAAWQVRSGTADCCLATKGAARMFGLGFIPLVSERYDLVFHRKHLELPAIQTLLDTLNRVAFRRELEELGGYDTRVAGQRLQ